MSHASPACLTPHPHASRLWRMSHVSPACLTSHPHASRLTRMSHVSPACLTSHPHVSAPCLCRRMLRYADVSIREHTSHVSAACLTFLAHASGAGLYLVLRLLPHYVSIRPHTSAYVRIRPHTRMSYVCGASVRCMSLPRVSSSGACLQLYLFCSSVFCMPLPLRTAMRCGMAEAAHASPACRMPHMCLPHAAWV
jgi:hypothetical protein